MTKEQDDQWMGRITRCVESIRQWEQLTSAGDGTVEPGSRIDREDPSNPGLPFSVAAWSSIAMAVDHLGLADDAISREGGGKLRPFAFYTVCRGALVAASQAIWIMTGSRDTRLRRLQLLELAELEGMNSFLRDYTQDDSLAELVSEDFMDGLIKQADDVTLRHKTLKASLRPTRGEGSVTQILKDSSKVIQGSRDDDPWLIRAYLSEWRLSSGAAHARIWPGDLRPHETVPLIGQGQRLRISTGTLESYGTSLAAATMATSEAFTLWDLHAKASAGSLDGHQPQT
jgi:hypothetical protein